jgi:hypothetical protein
MAAEWPRSAIPKKPQRDRIRSYFAARPGRVRASIEQVRGFARYGFG